MGKKGITISSLIKSISEQIGLPQGTVKTILSEFLGTAMRHVSEEERVVLRGFGTFYAKEKKARRYRHPRTGEIHVSEVGTIPAFRPSKVLTREMDSNHEKGAKKDSGHKGGNSRTQTLPTRKDRTIPKAEECEIVISMPNPQQTDDLIIAFSPTSAYDRRDAYPIVLSPAKGSLLKLPRYGRSNIRGYKEPDFLTALQEEFADIKVSDDMHMKVPGRITPYEPDFVLYDEALNLYIDVEIDEPYDGFSRLATHTIEGRDAVRDIFFKESGWVVVRFTERQVHLSCSQCINYLRSIVDSMRGQAVTLPYIAKKEGRWNKNQSAQWERELYREKYLGIQVFTKQDRTRKIQCLDPEEGIDKVIQRTPVHYPEARQADVKRSRETESTVTERIKAGDAQAAGTRPGTAKPLSEVFPPEVVFKEETHTYSTPGDVSGNTDRMSVTTLIEMFFPHFDEDAYIQKKMGETGMTEEAVRKELAEPSERGTDLHKQIENFLKGLPYDSSSKEFQHFLRFHQEQVLQRGLTFDSAEFPVELKDANIAGTVDALFRKPNGEFVMVDWKRSKHLIIDGYPKKYGFGRGLSVLSHLDNSSYYKYEIQQSFYKYILEKDYKIKVSSMILVVLYPDYDNYYFIKLDDYRKQEVLDMIASYESILK